MADSLWSAAVEFEHVASPARSEAARLGDVTLQIVRDWVLRFNAEGPRGLIDRKPPGQPRLLTAQHRQALMAIVESGPTPAIHGVVRWRLCDLGQWLWEEFQLSVTDVLTRLVNGWSNGRIDELMPWCWAADKTA